MEYPLIMCLSLSVNDTKEKEPRLHLDLLSFYLLFSSEKGFF